MRLKKALNESFAASGEAKQALYERMAASAVSSEARMATKWAKSAFGEATRVSGNPIIASSKANRASLLLAPSEAASAVPCSEATLPWVALNGTKAKACLSSEAKAKVLSGIAKIICVW